MKPNIVFVINYFYPDYASTGQILTELCLHLQHDFNITVIAAQPGYNIESSGNTKKFEEDKLESIRVLRIRLPKVDKTNKISRLRYIAAYFLYANLLLLRQRDVDFVYTISQPPILGGTIGTIGKMFKGAKHIYNIQDFNPEQAEAVGFSKKPWLMNLARWVDTLNCRIADHIITVGYDMRETLEKRFGYKKVTANTVIHNWTNEEEITPLSKDHPRVREFIATHQLEGKFVVMYSGNLGLYYDLENLIRITDQFQTFKDLVFVFIGEGAAKEKMQTYAAEHGIEQVRFIPYQPKEDLVYSLNAADLHLVVNQKGIKGVSVPSKIYGVMAAGKPVLGVLEEGSEAYQLIEKSGNGLLAAPQQYENIIRRLMEMCVMDRSLLRTMGMNGRVYLEKHLKRETSMNKYRDLLLQLASANTSKVREAEYPEMEVPR